MPILVIIIIYVKDELATVAFYHKAFGLEQRFLHESNQYAEMETGQTILAFANETFIWDSHQFQPIPIVIENCSLQMKNA